MLKLEELFNKVTSQNTNIMEVISFLEECWITFSDRPIDNNLIRRAVTNGQTIMPITSAFIELVLANPDKVGFQVYRISDLKTGRILKQYTKTLKNGSK